jgi:hypothetical protein
MSKLLEESGMRGQIVAAVAEALFKYKWRNSPNVVMTTKAEHIYWDRLAVIALDTVLAKLEKPSKVMLAVGMQRCCGYAGEINGIDHYEPVGDEAMRDGWLAMLGCLKARATQEQPE